MHSTPPHTPRTEVLWRDNYDGQVTILPTGKVMADASLSVEEVTRRIEKIRNPRRRWWRRG